MAEAEYSPVAQDDLKKKVEKADHQVLYPTVQLFQIWNVIVSHCMVHSELQLSSFCNINTGKVSYWFPPSEIQFPRAERGILA